MNSPNSGLRLNATQDEILAKIGEFKIHAFNLAYATITDSNSQYLEAREIKTLTDLVLSLEDSITVEDTEGKQARTVKRLMDRYTTTGEEGVLVNKSSQLTIKYEVDNAE